VGAAHKLAGINAAGTISMVADNLVGLSTKKMQTLSRVARVEHEE
jgi:hypothetical protein